MGAGSLKKKKKKKRTDEKRKKNANRKDKKGIINKTTNKQWHRSEADENSKY